ncbi:hypothetical protein THAOC_29062, partial [Thalassiosira oceanica]
MADDGSEKKPIMVSIKDMLLNSVKAVLAAMTARAGQVAQLESSEVQRLRSENAQLRRRNQQLEGNHEVLRVAVVPATVFVVDLSRVDTSIVAHVASFLGESPELLNLALTCKSFGWPQPASSLNLSLVEGVARQTVRSRATKAEMGSLPAYTRGTATWLSILNRFEHLLDFDVLLANGRRLIEYKNGDPSVVCGCGTPFEMGDDPDFSRCTAVTSGYVMTSGVHFVQFYDISCMPCIGIVRPMPGLDADRYLDSGDFGF